MDDVCSDIAASSAASQASDLAELKAVCASILREDFKQDFDQRWSQTLSGLEDLHSLHYRFYLDAELQVTGTSISECCLISQEVLAILKALQVRCVWVTHLFMLLDRICDINERLPGAKIDYLHISETDAYHVEFGRGPDDSQARAGYNRTVLDERITE